MADWSSVFGDIKVEPGALPNAKRQAWSTGLPMEDSPIFQTSGSEHRPPYVG